MWPIGGSKLHISMRYHPQEKSCMIVSPTQRWASTPSHFYHRQGRARPLIYGGCDSRRTSGYLPLCLSWDFCQLFALQFVVVPLSFFLNAGWRSRCIISALFSSWRNMLVLKFQNDSIHSPALTHSLIIPFHISKFVWPSRHRATETHCTI